MKEKRKLPKILEFDEEQRLLNWTHHNRSFRDYVVILTILRTGLRTNELRGALVSDISADGEILTHLEVRAKIAHDKTAREVPIPNNLREQLKSYLNWKQQRGESTKPMSFLFASAKSPQLTVRHLQRIVRESSIGALGKPYRVHDLRRTFEERYLTEPNCKNTETTFSDFAKPESEQNTKSKNNADSTPGEIEIVQPKQGVWRTYDATDGLPGGVWCLLQDQHGYLWLGTSVEKDTGTGLCRYDGASFITYTTDDGLADNYVMSIYEDHQGRLWLGTPKGISCFDGQRFTNYTTEDGLADNYICAICEDRQGRLWIGTREGGVSCFDGQRFTNYTRENGLPYYGVSAICEDRQGCLWFGTKGIKPGGAARFDGQDFITYAPADGLASDSVISICEDRQGCLWFGTWDSGVSMFDGQQFTNYTTADGLGNNHVWTICEDRQGTLWFGFEWAGGGVSRLIDSERSRSGEPCFITYTTEDGLLDNKVYDIIQDREGHLWFAHSHSGLTCFDPETVQSLTRTSVSQILVQDIEGRLWFGNSNELCCLRFDTEQQRHQTPGLSSRRCIETFNAIIFSLVEDSKGGVWVGTQGDGIYHYDSSDAVWDGAGETVHEVKSPLPPLSSPRMQGEKGGNKGGTRSHFTTQNGLSDDAVLSLLETRDGTIWAGTWSEGWIFGDPACLCRFDGEAFEAIETPHPVICRLFEDSCGRIWMGGWAGGGLSCYDGKTLVTYTMADGLPNDSVQSIVEDDAGNLWIGTLQGLCRFDGKRFVTYGEAQGISCLRHHCSTKDATGQLWFGTLMGGLYRYNGKHFQQLTTADGLPSNCVTGLVPQPDGSMIIGTYHGIVHYRPTATIPPPVEIREVVADEVYRNPTELELNTTGADLLTISYHGLSFATHQMRYSYILEGYDFDTASPTQSKDKEWQDTWENHAHYKKLPVGEYTFKVIAINRDLVSSEAPATLKLTIRPDPRDFKIAALQTEVAHLRHEVGSKYDFENIIGCSTAIKQVCALMEKAIDSGLNVLITGETGTGKELVAKAIHYNSPRKDKPLLDRNCGAFPKDLIASELFGHRKGAYTGAYEDEEGLFEAAEGGTVILDEIGEMSQDAQVHLLRVLQEHKVQRLGEFSSRDVDVRVIAISNRNLRKEVEAGRFREDLYHRLNVFRIHVPPLRERPDDIPLLAEHFLKQASLQQDKEVDGFAPDVMDMLQSYSWLGNIRELENEIYQAVAHVEKGLHIQTYHFSSQITGGESLIQEVLSERMGYSELLDRFRRRLIEDALRKSGGNRSEAARQLGMHRPNLVELIKRLGIDTDSETET